MDIFAKLAASTLKENSEGDLPDFIVPLLMKVAENPADFAGREALVEELVMRETGNGAAGEVSHGVAAGADRGQADVTQAVEHVGQ